MRWDLRCLSTLDNLCVRTCSELPSIICGVLSRPTQKGHNTETEQDQALFPNPKAMGTYDNLCLCLDEMVKIYSGSLVYLPIVFVRHTKSLCTVRMSKRHTFSLMVPAFECRTHPQHHIPCCQGLSCLASVQNKNAKQ